MVTSTNDTTLKTMQNSRTTPESWQQGLDRLAEQGLNLVAVFDCSTLPESVTGPLRAAGIDWGAPARLVLLGNGGPRFWEVLTAHGIDGPDPVDRFSRELAERLIHDHLGDAPVNWLYPGPVPVPLQRLGALAGWHHPSPLGIGINARFGLWFAYRVAFLVERALPPTEPLPGDSPCSTCRDKPCVSACPARAVSADAPFDIPRCSDHRLRSDSSCAFDCLARRACPVTPEARYPAAQIAYHYRLSLDTLRTWHGDR